MSLLLRDVELNGSAGLNVLVRDGLIAGISAEEPRAADEILDGGGGALLRGLNDHHLHLFAMAAAETSIRCGPADVADVSELAATLRRAAAAVPAGTWLRGTGYDDGHLGELTAAELDRLMGDLADRPVRISHRGGHAWLLNSRARRELGLPVDGGLLLDADDLIRARLGGTPPSLREISRRLAAMGVTGVTDAGVNNGPGELAHLRAAVDRGDLVQHALMLGTEKLPWGEVCRGVRVGAVKIVLAEHDLPGLDELVERITDAGPRGVAVHAASLEALALATVGLEQAGRHGQRVEHASVAPPELLKTLTRLGTRVVTQPGFIARHGDRYLSTVDRSDQPWLYRLRGWLDSGGLLAAGSDAPYGPDDPWAAMDAAVTRRTDAGQIIGPDEALTPEQALALFTSPLEQPGTAAPPIRVGDPADLCLLATPWQEARKQLSAVQVRATLIAGHLA